MDQESTSALPSSRDEVVYYPRNAIRIEVTGLKPDSTPEMLRDHFSKQGTVLDAYIPRIRDSDKNRNYGFVVMLTDGLKLSSHDQVINNHAVKLSTRCLQTPPNDTILYAASEALTSNILNEFDLRDFFSRFGTVKDVVKGRNRHFAFVIFDAEKSLEDSTREFNVNFRFLCFNLFTFSFSEEPSYEIKGHTFTVQKSRWSPDSGILSSFMKGPSKPASFQSWRSGK